VVPQSINHFQQLNSATISAVLSPGITLGQALATLKTLAKDILPQNYSIDYSGESRQYVQESSALLLTFFFALIIIFLALAALFEASGIRSSWLVSVPMSICGAMISSASEFGQASLNIFYGGGPGKPLIGLVSKHGILIVQFANDLQREGKGKREAVDDGGGHPPATDTDDYCGDAVLGVLPLVFASGAGAADDSIWAW